MKQYDLIIIGSGIAGIGLAKKARSLSTHTRILLVTESSGDFYHKPDLSVVFSNKNTPSNLILEKSVTWSAEHSIDVIEFTHVSEVDTCKKTIVANCDLYQYDKLVLATGSTPNHLVANKLDNVPFSYWNHFTDFSDYFHRAKDSKSVTIVGGGMVAVELACDLALAEKSVTLVSRGPLLSRDVPSTLSSFLATRLEKAGVHVLTDQTINKAKVETKIVLTLDNSVELTTDHIIVAAGLVPNTKLAQQIGCKIQQGVVCDEFLQTSVIDVYAIGDCAQIQDKCEMLIEPIERCIEALALTLAVECTPYLQQPTSIFLKSPLCPVVIHVPQAQVTEWVVNLDEAGASALALDAEKMIVGYVTMGSHCRFAGKMRKQLNRHYEPEKTKEAI